MVSLPIRLYFPRPLFVPRPLHPRLFYGLQDVGSSSASETVIKESRAQLRQWSHYDVPPFFLGTEKGRVEAEAEAAKESL